MTLVYPDWWMGDRWDVEELFDDLFNFDQNGAAVFGGALKVEPFGPSNAAREEHLQSGGAYLLVHRAGGQLNSEPDPWVDKSIQQLAALTRSRRESNKLMSYVTSVLRAFGTDGGTVHRSPQYVHPSGLSTTFMAVPGEVVGPQLIPELFRDERQTPAMWGIHVDVPRGLPDYRELLGLDNE